MNTAPEARPTHRAIRSYVLRAGRITVAQQRALQDLWPRYGIGFRATPLDLDQVFGRRAPRVMEIGFGDGDALVRLALQEPGMDFLGVEVHEPGVGHCLLLIEKLGLTNVRLIRHDAVEVLSAQLPDGTLRQVNLFFPDPWPKKRHHKRRIVQPEFAALVAAKLEPGGLFHVATDWPPYAEHIAAVLDAQPEFEREEIRAAARSETKFERRGRRLGHEIFECLWRRSTRPRR
jgi:tRNA (guanine-N7-)-methyltransferase